MKIPAGCNESPQPMCQIHKTLRDQVACLAFALPGAVDAQQFGIHEFLALLLPHMFPDDHLHAAMFVLQ